MICLLFCYNLGLCDLNKVFSTQPLLKSEKEEDFSVASCCIEFIVEFFYNSKPINGACEAFSALYTHSTQLISSTPTRSKGGNKLKTRAPPHIHSTSCSVYNIVYKGPVSRLFRAWEAAESTANGCWARRHSLLLLLATSISLHTQPSSVSLHTQPYRFQHARRL